MRSDKHYIANKRKGWHWTRLLGFRIQALSNRVLLHLSQFYCQDEHRRTVCIPVNELGFHFYNSLEHEFRYTTSCLSRAKLQFYAIPGDHSLFGKLGISYVSLDSHSSSKPDMQQLINNWQWDCEDPTFQDWTLAGMCFIPNHQKSKVHDYYNLTRWAASLTTLFRAITLRSRRASNA